MVLYLNLFVEINGVNNMINVRFPNESFSQPVPNFKIEEFEMTKIFDNEVFGKWRDIYVAISREDYDRLKK